MRKFCMEKSGTSMSASIQHIISTEIIRKCVFGFFSVICFSGTDGPKV